jgi:hypothetical protein
VDRLGQDPDEVARGRVVEAHGAADQRRRRAALAVAEDLVAFAGVLEVELEDARRGDARLAAQAVPVAARHEREVAGLEPARVRVADLEQHAAVGDDVEPEVSGHRVQRHSPRRAQLGAAVERPVHAQEVERLAKGIGRRP